MLRILSLVGFLILFVCPVWAGYGPPLDLSPVETAADPAVIQVDGIYYLYVTSTAVDISCWSSDDLVQWEYEGVVWEQKAAGAWNDVDVWAPEVHRDGDDFFLYYTASMMVGVARAEHPWGPFEDVFDHPFVGGGYGGVEGLAIDAHVFQDDDGRRYFYYAGYAPFSVIRAACMADMTSLIGDHITLVEPGLWNWELFVTEAPWIVKHEGIYYLMYSGGGANLPVYAVGYAASEHPLGPYAEFAGNPFLDRDQTAGIFGPGHNCVTVSPDQQLKIVYHTKQEAAVGWDREIRINDLCFTDGGRMYVGLDGCTEADDDATDDDTQPGDLPDDDEQETDVDEEDEQEGCGC